MPLLPQTILQMVSSKEVPSDFDGPTVLQLLQRGDSVSITKGRVAIQPKSRLPLPSRWLEIRQACFSWEIISQLSHDVYLYESYTTGSYPNKAGGRSDGVTLQFRGSLSGERRYVVFNAKIRRKNKSARGKIGDILPNKQFSAGPDSHFAKFWQATGLPAPQRKGRYSNSMGKLKGLLFVAEVDHGERLKKQSIRPLELDRYQLLEMFGVIMKNHPETIAKQNFNISQTTPSNIEPAETKQWRGLQTDSTTGASSHGNAVIREDGNPLPLKSPKEQTNEEWIEDYIGQDREPLAVQRHVIYQWEET